MKRPTGKGVTLQRGDAGFDAAVLGTSFSGADPGHRPKILVQANSTEEVVAAVLRAKRENLKISICSGGHSWAQNHIREGGMLIDMGRFNKIEIDPTTRRAKVGPGCWSIDLDHALKKHRLFFPIAHAPDVCLGGFLLQGGFGWNSRALGLGCENVVGLDLVLADGTIVHASETENPDLYWAARGAGPGFFAIVTRYHLKLHTRPKVTAMVMQVFRMKHMEEVLSWAHRVGPEVSPLVEFQMVLTPEALGIRSPGIELIAPVMASSWKEAREATAFVTRSPVRSKASIALPMLPISTTIMSQIASRTHFPPKMHWCVDNMWTNAPIENLLPGLRKVADTLPPAPSHALWLSWHPKAPRQDMAFSVEANNYFAAYGEWKNAADNPKYENWATERLTEMAQHSAGIQLADENLARRPARFLSEANAARLEQIRATRDPEGRFQTYRGRP